MTNAEKLVAYLVREGLHITAAESCTGGLISAGITDVPGASSVFEGGIVSYSERIKNEFLSVSSDILERKGAVSFETAAAMARGAANAFKSDIALAATGYAGPDGGEPGKPVGRVYIGIYIGKPAAVNGTYVYECLFHGTRAEIRCSAREKAFAELCRLLSL